MHQITQKQTVKEDFESPPERGRSVIRKHSRSFSVAAWLLPSSIRDDVEKLYAWCRWCDDAVDDAPTPAEAEKRLDLLRDDVRRVYRGESPEHFASQWLAELVVKHDIVQRDALALLDGMGMDLHLGQIETEEQLLDYCHHAAGVVGWMMCSVFGVTNRQALQHAKSLGIAMQLTNIARDVREDAERGRCYLPATWLPYGVATSSERQLEDTVRRVLDLAENYYQHGTEGITYLPVEVRSAIRIAAAVYRTIGVEIRRRNYQVLRGRTVTPKLRFAAVAIAAWSDGLRTDLVRRFTPETTSTTSISCRSKQWRIEMNDAKYLMYLGLSLTSFMASALFLLVMLNPKDESYAAWPMTYAAVCLGVGGITNWLAKRSEVSPTLIPVVDQGSHRAESS
ncbi:MAG: phytoene/squalene synthase family protein [Planctomycetota bacterium]